MYIATPKTIRISIGKQCTLPHQLYKLCISFIICLLSYPVMATIPNTSLIPTSPSTSEDTQTSGTDLEEISMEDEMNTDTNKWSDKERKKLQTYEKIS